MFIMGIRADIDVVPRILERSKAPSVEQVISSMPKIRSGISRRSDSFDEWKTALIAINSNLCMISDKKENRLIKA